MRKNELFNVLLQNEWLWRAATEKLKWKKVWLDASLSPSPLSHLAVPHQAFVAEDPTLLNGGVGYIPISLLYRLLYEIICKYK